MDDDKLTTPWHLRCLSVRPDTLAFALQWECPDYVPSIGDVSAPIVGDPSVPGVSESSNELIAAI